MKFFDLEMDGCIAGNRDVQFAGLVNNVCKKHLYRGGNTLFQCATSGYASNDTCKEIHVHEPKAEK
jgi:hypothetical protein